jgi:hypothetical protein
MKIMELITDRNGTLSHTKLWSNIANLVASSAFIINTYKYPMSAELLTAFVLSVGAQRVASKYLDIKDQKNTTKEVLSDEQPN